MAAVALWSRAIPAGEKVEVVPLAALRITNAALDAELADQNARSVIKLEYVNHEPLGDEMDEDEDEEKDEEKMTIIKGNTVLCALTPGKIEQANLDVVLTENDEYVFHNTGKNLIYLTGNYIDQGEDQDPDDDSDDEAGYRLGEVSSDVEIDPEELDMVDDSDEEEDNSHRFEEIKDEEPKSKKRARDSDAAGTEGDGEKKLSKKEKKALKKQKVEDGTAVPTVEVNGADKSDKEKKDKKDKKADSEEGLKELPSGLKIKDVKTGTGPVAKKGDKISMRYIGKFTDGKIFDKNVKGAPFSFKLGAGEVIKGWDEGIVGMQVGGERLLIVPAKLGYGNRKIDSIPAGSTLKFECKLISLK